MKKNNTSSTSRLPGMPSELPFSLFRSMRTWIETGPKAWTITASTKKQFRLLPANTPALRERVYRLGCRIYKELGYSQLDSEDLLYCRFDALPNTLPLLVVDENGRDVATLTLVFDGSEFGLPLDEIFQSEADTFRNTRKKTAEIMRLAMDPATGARNEILLHLFNFAYIYALHIQKCDGFLITVNPRHEPYYRRALHFRQIGNAKPFPKVNNAPAALLYLCFQYAAEKVKLEAGRPAAGKRSLYPFLFPAEAESFIAQYLAHRHSPMSAEEMRRFSLGVDSLNNDNNSQNKKEEALLNAVQSTSVKEGPRSHGEPNAENASSPVPDTQLDLLQDLEVMVKEEVPRFAYTSSKSIFRELFQGGTR